MIGETNRAIIDGRIKIPGMKPIVFRNSDQTFWLQTADGLYSQVELVERSYLPGKKWARNNIVESFDPHAMDFDIICDTLARVMWDVREERRRQQSFSE